VEALERGAAAGDDAKGPRRRVARAPAGARVGLVWTQDEEVLGRPLAAGEYLAVDFFCVGPDEAGCGSRRTVERATSDPRDLGIVYDAAGVRIGRVVKRDGPLVTTKLDSSTRGRA
jgi:hypothetical protein